MHFDIVSILAEMYWMVRAKFLFLIHLFIYLLRFRRVF